MSRPYVCDTCGDAHYVSKRPVGWRVALTPCREMLTHTCTACLGATAAAKPSAGTPRRAKSKAATGDAPAQRRLL